jgi:hypothetical protein
MIDLVEILKINVQNFPWQCPYCEKHTIIEKNSISISNNFVNTPEQESGEHYGLNVQTKIIICPNAECRKTSVYISLYNAENVFTQGSGNRINNISLILGSLYVPDKKIRVFPSFIPLVLLDDYKESVLISSLSPKASATISRRCLQGIIRDYWKIKPGRLIDEINQIDKMVDEITYNAIDSVRKIGNIGAHMEKDINVIVDVDENEAQLLIQLNEYLFDNWYIAKHDREERLLKIKAIADSKK